VAWTLQSIEKKGGGDTLTQPSREKPPIVAKKGTRGICGRSKGNPNQNGKEKHEKSTLKKKRIISLVRIRYSEREQKKGHPSKRKNRRP